MYITETSKIERFVISPKHTFADATVETCIIVLSKNKPGKSFLVERWDQENLDSYSIDIKSITKENNYIFPVYSNESVQKIIEKIK